MKKNSLGDRMKSYEDVNRNFLIPKLHTVLRLDGRAFHTYTKGFIRPYDNALINAMNETARYLCMNIQGAAFAYVQSDEITIYLTDTADLETQMWYGGNIQKMVSVSAAMATSAFNKTMLMYYCNSRDGDFRDDMLSKDDISRIKMAEFDSRIFQLPNEHEVFNCVLWRQQDCVRNSISAVAQSMFSHKELHKKSVKEMKQMCLDKGYDWNELEDGLKHGRMLVREMSDVGVETFARNEMKSSDEMFEPMSSSDITIQHAKTPASLRSVWKAIGCPLFMDDRTWLYDKINDTNK